MKNNYKIEELYSTFSYNEDYRFCILAIAINFVSLFELETNQILKSKYKTLFDIFSEKYNISFKTIELNEYYLNISSNVEIKGLYLSPLTKSYSLYI